MMDIIQSGTVFDFLIACVVELDTFFDEVASMCGISVVVLLMELVTKVVFATSHVPAKPSEVSNRCRLCASLEEAFLGVPVIADP